VRNKKPEICAQLGVICSVYSSEFAVRRTFEICVGEVTQTDLFCLQRRENFGISDQCNSNLLYFGSRMALRKLLEIAIRQTRVLNIDECFSLTKVTSVIVQTHADSFSWNGKYAEHTRSYSERLSRSVQFSSLATALFFELYPYCL
jgi:hypothetical protein